MTDTSKGKKIIKMFNSSDIEASDKPIKPILIQELTQMQALVNLIKFSIPAILSTILTRGRHFISFLFIARLDNPNFIAGAGIGHSTANILGISMIIGLSSAIETLASHAFGSKNNYLAGCYYNRAQVITTLVFTLQAIVLWNIESILIYLGQPEESAHYGALYVRVYLPGLYAACHTEILRRFLNAQGIFKLLVQVQVFTGTAHIAWLYIFMYIFDMGIIGMAIASSITNFLNFTVTALYITIKKDIIKEGSWHCINKDSFIGLYEYLKVGFPAMMMICLQILGFEAIVILSGYIGVNEQGAGIIILSLSSVLYTVSVGISIAATSLVGNNLGANKPQTAELYANLTLGVTTIISLIFVILLGIFKSEIAKLLTSHKEIQDLVSDVIPIIVLFTIPDFVKGAAGGIIVAMGYQKFGSYSGLISYWIVSLPVSYILAFNGNMGLIGLWLGTAIGLYLVCAGFLIIIYCADWEALAQKISTKVNSDAKTVTKQ